MKEENTAVSLPAGGGSTLMVIFAVLCLLTFAVLSVATVTADRRLAEASRKSVEDWYAADTQAEEILFALREGKSPEGVSEDGNIYRYDCPIGENRRLTVEVKVDGTDYEILRWQAVNVSSQDYSDGEAFWSTEVTGLD